MCSDPLGVVKSQKKPGLASWAVNCAGRTRTTWSVLWNQEWLTRVLWLLEAEAVGRLRARGSEGRRAEPHL